MNGSIEEFLEWKQQQIEHSEISHSLNFNFLFDGPDSARHLAKQCESENSYCFLSPKALQRANCTEDLDPKAFLTSVLDETFFSEIASKTSPQSWAHTLVDTSPMEKQKSHKQVEQKDSIAFGNQASAQPILALDHLKAGLLLHDSGVPLYHRLEKDKICSTCIIGGTSETKFIRSKHSKKKVQKDAILEALKNETLIEKDILQRFGRSQHISHILREILREGLIHRLGNGGIKDPYRYYAQQHP